MSRVFGDREGGVRVDQKSKVSRYLLGVDDTVPPHSRFSQAERSRSSKNAPRSVGTGTAPKAKQPETLTPSNVVQQIRNDIILVLGLRPGINAKFSPLEEGLISALELVLRKGYCPSTIVRQKIFFEALLSLKKFFDQEKVGITLDGIADKTGNAEVLVFPALYHYAREAAYCDRKIKELRTEMVSSISWNEREKMRREVVDLRQKKNEALLFYQKIIFSDAEHLRQLDFRRRITLFGKDATLDDLIRYYKSGGQFSNAPPSPAPAVDDSLSMAHVDMTPVSSEPKGAINPRDWQENEDVLDWKTLKREPAPGVAGDDQSQSFDFNL